MRRLDCVLLVDDSEADTFLHQLVLEELDCVETIRTAQHGREALDYLARAHGGDPDSPVPHLVFLDINMPVMDGWAFLDEYERLYAQDARAIVVAMVSTSQDPRDRERAHEHAIVRRYETKPLTRDAVLALLREYHPDRFA